ncbi:peptidase M17, leucyl aminopeptidase, C-terminal [Hyaloraphidium curvatum]|nr:peptidase M17, leucyl aminopeptidase, C-terminal [Hyaloraphidium curvatum]
MPPADASTHSSVAVLLHSPGPPSPSDLAPLTHVLTVLDVSDEVPGDCPDGDVLRGVLRRRKAKPAELSEDPVQATAGNGGLRVWTALDPSKDAFHNLTTLREAFSLLLEEDPSRIDAVVLSQIPDAGEMAAYVGLANGAPLPHRKASDFPLPLKELKLWAVPCRPARAAALAAANHLCRSLTALPHAELGPAAYRARAAELAGEKGWGLEVFDAERLARMGAGCFLAVAKGSEHRDACIVRLSYVPKAPPKGSVALVGKGICFDVGGHNIKPGEDMRGMHEDMGGSAAVLGVIHAASELALPLRIDAWLAIADNDLSPRAMRPGDVVRACNGTTVEIVDTDAEGRLALADALALACRSKPDLVVDFATLTYGMIAALGYRRSGIFASDPHLAALAVDAGIQSGERVTAFPFDDDYDTLLDSDSADVKQCSAGEDDPDHILAARFLSRFVGGRPWVHADLSAAACEDGLGAIGTEQTGFGVAWGVRMLEMWMEGREGRGP